MAWKETVQRLMDHAEIIERKCSFARAADAGDAEAMVAFFTPGVTASYDPGAPAMEGRDVVHSWYADRLEGVLASSHHLSNFEIAFPHRDTAELRCYLYSWQRFEGHPERPDRHRWARYLDSWVRTDQGWLQSSLTCLGAGETPATAPERVGEYRRAGY